jgi:hypothetical protein
VFDGTALPTAEPTPASTVNVSVDTPASTAILFVHFLGSSS